MSERAEMEREAIRQGAVRPCARCGMRPCAAPSVLCEPCQEYGPLTPQEAARWYSRLDDD